VTTIYEALASVMAAVDHVAKRERNTQGRGYNFRGIDAVVNAVGPVLREHKVIVAPDVREYHYGEILSGKDRTPMGHARVVVAYTFYGPEGDTLVCSAAGEAFDSGDKATAKAMSVAFRTALLQSLALPTDEPDPDLSTYERAPQTVNWTPHQDSLNALKAKVWEMSQSIMPSLDTANRKQWIADELENLGASADVDGLTRLIKEMS
jgi:hypothetical protein